MTAQVFRSAQSPTFYISDVLAPSPGGGLSGTFTSLAINANPASADPLVVSAAGVELLRISDAGIAQNLSATQALALAPPNTTLSTFPMASGSFSPAWTNLSGITNPPSVLVLYWQRLGNVVSCAVYGEGLSTTGAGNFQATLTVPVASAGLATLAQSCAGCGTLQVNSGGFGQSVSVFGNSGANNRVVVFAGANSVSASSGIRLAFSYLVS